MKVAIVVICYNLDSRIFLLQMEAIKKFCKDDYTVEIFDNSTDPEKAEAIRYHAAYQNLSYTKTFARAYNGSTSHAWACNFSYHKLKDKYDIFTFMDHDVLPLRSYSMTKILGEDKIFAGMPQGKNGITYFWPGMVSFNNRMVDKELIDFYPEEETGLDTGGKLHYAIEKYGEDNCVFFNEAYHQNAYFNGKDYNWYSVINNNMFMHFVNSSNWNPIEDNDERISSLINIAKEKIEANIRL